ncbi:hypothetical protein VNO77_31930 [Canavalia gladiata]|uniref:Uncharacterized protein n=1 Tax=Canavalia gladiata TaxID=3824 RepID=A0AAN9KPC9_CANGL
MNGGILEALSHSSPAEKVPTTFFDLEKEDSGLLVKLSPIPLSFHAQDLTGLEPGGCLELIMVIRLNRIYIQKAKSHNQSKTSNLAGQLARLLGGVIRQTRGHCLGFSSPYFNHRLWNTTRFAYTSSGLASGGYSFGQMGNGSPKMLNLHQKCKLMLELWHQTGFGWPTQCLAYNAIRGSKAKNQK